MVSICGGCTSCFFFADDFNHVGFLSAEGYFVTHYFVFDGVFERCIEYHFHCFSLNEPHFNDATAESSVSEDFNDDAFFASFQFREFHVLFTVLIRCKDRVLHLFLQTI